MRRITLSLLVAILLGGCSSGESLVATTPTALDESEPSEAVEPTIPASTSTSTPTSTVPSLPDETVPAGIAAVDTATWLSFSMEESFETDGLSTSMGIVNDAGDLLILTPNSYPHHMLSLSYDDTDWIITETEWGFFWNEPEDPSDADPWQVRAILEPLFEQGPFSGEREMDFGVETLAVVYDIAPVTEDGQRSATVRIDGLDMLMVVIFESPEVQFDLPDPSTGEWDEMALGPEAVVGDAAIPVIAAWYEAYHKQKS